MQEPVNEDEDKITRDDLYGILVLLWISNLISAGSGTPPGGFIVYGTGYLLSFVLPFGDVLAVILGLVSLVIDFSAVLVLAFFVNKYRNRKRKTSL